jgi:adenine phosphoribosyltransferase
MNYKKHIESFDNFPKQGVKFWDFTGILLNPEIFNEAILEIGHAFKDIEFNKIVAIEAKGFLIGGALALHLAKPLVLVRKPGFIPGKVQTQEFIKEYASGTYEMKENTLSSSDKVLIIYDILAAPGATLAAINLVKSQKAQVSGCAFMIELEYLQARKDLGKYKIHSVVKIAGKNE